MKRFLVLAALLAIVPTAALAATGSVTGWGPRVGASITPDQVVFGGQLHIGEIAPSLTFDPNLEVGLGDNETVIALNGDLQYHLHVTHAQWNPYLGGGLSVDFVSFDHPGPDDSETDVGANLIAGAEAPTRAGNRFFGEVRLGIGDIPSLKLIVGWNFKM